MKTSIKDIKSRRDQAEEKICDLMDWNFEVIQSEENEEKIMKKKGESLGVNDIQRKKLQIIGVSEGEKKEKGAESLLKKQWLRAP